MFRDKPTIHWSTNKYSGAQLVNRQGRQLLGAPSCWGAPEGQAWGLFFFFFFFFFLFFFFFFFTINKGVSCQGYWGLKKYWRLFLLYRSQNVVTPMTTSSSLNKHRAIINDISVASKKPPLRGPMSHGRPPIRSVNKKIKKTIRSVDSVHTVCTEFNVHSGSFKWSRRWRKMKRSYPSGSEKRKKKKEDEDRRKQDSGKWSR